MDPDKEETTDNRDQQQNARKKILINALKRTYSEFFNDIQPIPLKDKSLHVNEVFLGRGIKRLEMRGLHETWETLESHHRILEDLGKTATRFMLLGEHGYGKSTLAQQLAYDWRTECRNSPLREVEIFILLKLSQVKHSTPIVVSIKKLLLSNEPNLSTDNVQEILSSTKSVVMLLEGFDKYVQEVKKKIKDEVMETIKGEMFRDFRVILTTTPLCKPRGMPQSTITVKLTGFDEDARDKYFRSALGETKEFLEIKSEIEANPMMCELCRVPFFFGIVLNLISEGKVPFSFKTVTKSFRYLFASFYEKMKSRLRDKDQTKNYDSSAKDHRTLNKLSFEVLTEQKQEERWVKKELRKLIGVSLYDHYIAVGILVEEEAVRIDESPNIPTSSLVQRITRTRFYHRIFRQWFAAHYISSQAKTFNFDKILKKISQSYSEYVFQFACGINSIASSKIIKYLQKCENSEIVELCILEQKECHTK